MSKGPWSKRDIYEVYSYSVIRTACPEVLRVFLYIDLATYRVVASVSVVIAQQQRLQQEGSTLQGSEELRWRRGFVRSH